MSHHLDRLFTQAMVQEAQRREPGLPRPRLAAGGRDDDDGDDGADAAPDPSAGARLLEAFKRKDYAACLGLPAVTLDAVGKPTWAVTDTYVC
jgi:hypothetical protein